MTSAPSATTWGSPTATKHALLIHGGLSSSHTWHRVAPSLAAQGYCVTAPNLIGHASRISTEFRLSSTASDLLPYLEARNYSLIIGHSIGASTVLSLFSHLPQPYPTAIVLIDPSMKATQEKLGSLDAKIADAYFNVKPAEAYSAENPLWTREDAIYRELGIRLCSIGGMSQYNRPWDLFSYFDSVPDKWKVTVLVADPAISQVCLVEHIRPYPHIRSVTVPGAGHWIQYEFPEVIVKEALKTLAELETA